jgi:hypothetical protein
MNSKRRKTFYEKCIYVLDNKIKNLKESTYNDTLNWLLSQQIKENRIENIRLKVTKRLNLKNSIRTSDYWIKRGWSEEEAYVKAKEQRKTINQEKAHFQ